jgi:hypothetical protein
MRISVQPAYRGIRRERSCALHAIRAPVTHNVGGTEIETKEPAVARLSERRVDVPISGVGMELEREPRADVSRGNWR